MLLLSQLHDEIIVEICETTNTIEWTCNFCSLKFNDGIHKHLYLFPEQFKEDYSIFDKCPKKHKIKSYSKIQCGLKCSKCLEIQEYCENFGYPWFCQSCHIQQLLLTEENQHMTFNPYQNTAVDSCVFWQCPKCSKLQINAFNDGDQKT